MPFTFLAHQAPVLPLVLLRPRWFDGVALCVGSMAPDLSYVVSGTACGFRSHTLPALLWFCLPTTLLIAALTRRISRPLLAHLPLRPTTRSAFTGVTPPLAITISSALLGAASHVALDAFTHRGGLGVAHFPWLRTVALHLGDRPVRVYTLLQHPGSLVLALLALLCLRALARRATTDEPPAVDRHGRRGFALVLAFGLPLSLLIVLAAYPVGGLPALVIRLGVLLFITFALAALAAEHSSRQFTARARDNHRTRRYRRP